MFRKIAEFIDHFRWPVLLAMIVSLFIMGNAAMRLKVDPSIEPLFIKNPRNTSITRLTARNTAPTR